MNITNNVASLQANQTFINSTKNQTNPTKEIPNQIIANRVNEANGKVIQAQDDILGTLLDIKA